MHFLMPNHHTCIYGFRVAGNSFDVIACAPVVVPFLKPLIQLSETERIISSCSMNLITFKGFGFCGRTNFTSRVEAFFNPIDGVVQNQALMALMTSMNTKLSTQTFGSIQFDSQDVAAMTSA
jgi:hypothetical protein